MSGETANEEIVTLDKKDLKKFIKVKVGLLSSNNYADSESAKEYSILKVKIGDKVDKILSLISQGKSGVIQGFISTNGKLIEEPGEITFQKANIKNMQVISVAAAEGIVAEPKEWIRFQDFYLTDYYYMSSSYWDAVVFIPKRDIWFFGFGLFSNYNNKDVGIKFQWNLGKEGEELTSEEH